MDVAWANPTLNVFFSFLIAHYAKAPGSASVYKED
jgi:hypothetical protein